MRFFYICCLFLLAIAAASAQPAVSYSQLPQDLQLFPRDGQNQAEVIISGQVLEAGFQQVSVVVSRDGNFWKYANQALSDNGNSPFRIPIIIRAEPVEYNFQVFVRRGADSVLVAERKRIVCGDAYILYGQSNALGLAGLDDYQIDDRLLRNVTYPFGSNNIPAEMRWYTAREPFGSVGMLGMEIQRRILQQYGIPTVFINGGIGGASILELSQRFPNNHADLNTYYGRLLYRAQWAGVVNNIKAIIYKQGENEAGGEPGGYAEKFQTFYNQLREDFGQQSKIYVGQINIMTPTVPGAGDLRDFQRRAQQLFPNLSSIATIGAVGYDGLHYEPRANQQLALEQYRLIARDIYGSTDASQINSPDIKKIAYNDRRDELTLYFDDEMQMVWPKDTLIFNPATGGLVSRSMNDFIYLDEQPGLVIGGRAEGNRIVLSLRGPQSARTVTYLPASYSTNELPFFQGPYLKNSRGMRAFSFSKVAIESTPIVITIPAAPTNLMANTVTPTAITLSWQDNADNESSFEIEQQKPGGDFIRIAQLLPNAFTFLATGLSEQTTYQFRVRTSNSAGPSPYSNTIAVTTPASLPLQPATLAITATAPTSVSFTWVDNAFNETGYEVERSSPGENFTKVAELAANSSAYIASGLRENTAYSFRVRAMNNAGPSPYSNTATATTPISIPLQPTTLTVVAATPNSLTINWLDNAFNETGYEVERSASGQSFTKVADLTANATSYVSSGLIETTLYVFRVRAINSAGASPYSTTTSVTTPATIPAAPTNLTAAASTPTSISLTWLDNAVNETGYEIEQSLAQGTFQKVATVGPNSTSFTSSSLGEGGTYQFRVRAINSAGSSDYSNIAISRPLILGVEDPDYSLKLYPNPLISTRILHVEHDRPIFTAFQVYGLDGRQMTTGQQRPTAKLTINLEQLPAGRYILELHTSQGAWFRRHFLIQ